MIEVDVRLKVGAFDLEVAFCNGEGVIALFGQSGSGKSLTFNLIAGLLRPERGRIILVKVPRPSESYLHRGGIRFVEFSTCV
jgi:ABC-type molybdate transport system ATPase subunit